MHEVTPRDKEILKKFLDAFNQRYPGKFLNGKKEHGGSIADYPIDWYIKQMEDEILDQWSYVQALKHALNEENKITM